MYREPRYYTGMDTTSYFGRNVRDSPDRQDITQEMCEDVVASPDHFEQQENRRWAYWGRPEGRELYLMVIVTEDRTALHNAFFDSNYTRKQRRGQ
jgi:hypothetical protein